MIASHRASLAIFARTGKKSEHPDSLEPACLCPDSCCRQAVAGVMVKIPAGVAPAKQSCGTPPPLPACNCRAFAGQCVIVKAGSAHHHYIYHPHNLPWCLPSGQFYQIICAHNPDKLTASEYLLQACQRVNCAA